METTKNGGEMFEVKCDECKTTIRRTDSVRESAAGGTCDECRGVLAEPIDAIVAILEAHCGSAREFEERDEARHLLEDAFNAWARKG